MKLTMQQWEILLKGAAQIYVMHMTGLPAEAAKAYVELKLAEKPDLIQGIAFRCM